MRAVILTIALFATASAGNFLGETVKAPTEETDDVASDVTMSEVPSSAADEPVATSAASEEDEKASSDEEASVDDEALGGAGEVSEEIASPQEEEKTMSDDELSSDKEALDGEASALKSTDDEEALDGDDATSEKAADDEDALDGDDTNSEEASDDQEDALDSDDATSEEADVDESVAPDEEDKMAAPTEKSSMGEDAPLDGEVSELKSTDDEDALDSDDATSEKAADDEDALDGDDTNSEEASDDQEEALDSDDATSEEADVDESVAPDEEDKMAAPTEKSSMGEDAPLDGEVSEVKSTDDEEALDGDDTTSGKAVDDEDKAPDSADTEVAVDESVAPAKEDETAAAEKIPSVADDKSVVPAAMPEEGEKAVADAQGAIDEGVTTLGGEDSLHDATVMAVGLPAKSQNTASEKTEEKASVAKDAHVTKASNDDNADSAKTAEVSSEQADGKTLMHSDHEDLLRSVDALDLKRQILANKAFQDKVRSMCLSYPNLQNCEQKTTEVAFCQLLQKAKPEAYTQLCANIPMDPTKLDSQQAAKKVSLPAMSSHLRRSKVLDDDLITDMVEDLE